MVVVSYNIRPKSTLHNNFLIERTGKFYNILDAKMFVDYLKSNINKHYMIVGKPIIHC
jgi:hypothetical protein